jgi:hypothetical protein
VSAGGGHRGCTGPGNLASSSPHQFRGAVGRPGCRAECRRPLKGKDSGSGRRPQHPSPAWRALDASGPRPGIGACGEPELRWIQGRQPRIGAPGSAAGEARFARLVPNTQMQPTGRGGPEFLVVRAPSWPDNGIVDLCGAGLSACS